MTQIIQAIQNHTGLRTAVHFGINTLAQMSLQRSFFPNTNYFKAFIDVGAVPIIREIVSSIFPRLGYTIDGQLFSVFFGVSTIAAFRFCFDSSYTVADMAALTITFLPDALLYLRTIVADTISQMKRVYENAKPANRELLEACKNGDATMANNAFTKGANGFAETIYRDFYMQIALKSGNPELILLMLTKTKSHQKLWGFILNEISFQQDNFPNDRNDIFNISNHYFNRFRLGYYSRDFFSPHEAISSIFEKDNVKLFKALWDIAQDDVQNRGKEILKLALRNGASKIATFLFEQGVTLPELEQIKTKYDLNINNFLPIIILALLKLDGLDEFIRLNHNELKEYLHLTKIASKNDLTNITGIAYPVLLNELLGNKCLIWEMATYLGLKNEKEVFHKEDELGLRPLDYAVLCSADLGIAFFDFLIRSDKNIITLGERTALHLFAIKNDDFYYYYILGTLLNESNECFSNKKRNNNIVDLVMFPKIHRQLPWGKIEFVNRADTFGVTPLHCVISNGPMVSLATVDSLLKAGAKDIPGSFIKSTRNPALPAFLKEKMKEKMSDNEKFEFLQLTASELAEKNKKFCEENNIKNNLAECIQLIKGEKTLAQILDEWADKT